jgi:hypothetical protein
VFVGLYEWTHNFQRLQGPTLYVSAMVRVPIRSLN